MKKDSIDTYRRMKRLVERLGKESKESCCIGLEMWAGGAWREGTEITFKRWVGGTTATSRCASLEGLEKEVLDDTTT